MEAEDAPEMGQAVLRPRRPGETIKVAETVLKRRDRNLKANAERAAKIAKLKQGRRDYARGKLRIVRVEKLVQQQRLKNKDRRRLKHQHKKPLPRAEGGKVLAVVRNGREGGSKDVKILLRQMRLMERHTLVFLPNVHATLEKLRTCRPFIYWGAPTFQMIFDLVHKKALFREPDSTKRSPLSDNSKIEEHLGDLGILCTEDLAAVIHECSENFEKVMERLWPMPLGDSRKAKGLTREKRYVYGDIREGITDRISQLVGGS